MAERLARKLAAIVYADVVGDSRLMGADEDDTHRRLSDYLDLVTSTIESHQGQVVHCAGDAVLAMFGAVVDALSCAVQIQREVERRNEALPDARKLKFRIGVNLGDVIEARGDIYGDGVNVAARLESLAEPGGICVSGSVYDAIGTRLALEYASIGEQAVKNITRPVRAYWVLWGAGEARPVPSVQQPTPAPSLADAAASVSTTKGEGEANTLQFESYRLDIRDARLWRGEDAVRLTNKSFGVLQHLVAHPAQLVTKDALLEAVWSTTHKSDSALAVCIRELRQTLGDDAKAPCFIETVRGRGYRFIAPVTAPTLRQAALESPLTRSSSLPRPRFSAPVAFVGREVELAQLHAWFARALRGERQVAFISGEAGIGKSTLVNAFLAQVATDPEVWIGHGQCIDHYGAGEAYLPVLEALGRLCRGSECERLLVVLRQYAPNWLSHMPALLSAEERNALQRALGGGTTRERMLRELAEAVEVLTAERPLVLVLEDLHWSDTSTLEWLGYATRRRDPARLLILGTYRPVEAMVQDHPLRAMMVDLKRQDQCAEWVLDYLSEDAIAAYLAQRAGEKPLPDGLARVIHARTGGNPLFMLSLVEALKSAGTLWEDAERWRLEGGLDAVAATVPHSVRELIEQQLGRLSTPAQGVLEAASVAGAVFSGAAVAAGVAQELETAELQLAELTREGQFVKTRGGAEWPDGTVSGRYQFVHTLYQEVLYARIPVGRRVRLHRQIGARLETGYGARAQEIASELAEHFVRGSDLARAVQYLSLAGGNALTRGAYRAAITHLTRGLETLKTLPAQAQASDARLWQARELGLRVQLAQALIAREGFGSQATVEAFERAHILVEEIGDTPLRFPVLYGRWVGHHVRGEHDRALSHAQAVLAAAQQCGDDDMLLIAHRVMGMSCVVTGELEVAREHLETALARYEPERHAGLALQFGQDPGIAARCYLAWALWLLGYPKQAFTMANDIVESLCDLDHVHTLAYAHGQVAFFAICVNDIPLAERAVRAGTVLAERHGLALWRAVATCNSGAILGARRQHKDAVEIFEVGLSQLRQSGTDFLLPLYLTKQAHSLGALGRRDEALEVMERAQQRVKAQVEHWIEAEVHRVEGDVWRQAPRPDCSAAETCFERALDIARAQKARSWELRAATSLTRLWRDQGKRREARDLLAPVYAWFSEGFDTPDLREAKALLDGLG